MAAAANAIATAEATATVAKAIATAEATDTATCADPQPSALDIFGGTGVTLDELVAWNKASPQ